jgi:putative transcriptional regulator
MPSQQSHIVATGSNAMTAPGTAIANAIRRLRFEHGEMSQQDLATRCAVTRQTIIALEAERYSPLVELSFRIARVFDVRVDELFFWRDDQRKVDNENK